jgi:predicted site-specific integrase-resolvase
MKAKEVMQKYGICRETLWRWVKSNKINYTLTPSGRYNYLGLNDNPSDNNRKNIIYARCSTSGQKDNLDRQIERLKTFASAKGITVDDVYHEIASALNYNRKFYRKLYNEITSNNVSKVIIEYKDRLLRIGFQDFEELCKIHKTEVIILDQTTDKTKSQEIVDDMIAIIHHFSSKIYSNRKRKKIIDVIKEDIQ